MKAKSINTKTNKKAPLHYDSRVKGYLEALRDSGLTNMLSAALYVEAAFGIPRKEADKCVRYWMGI